MFDEDERLPSPPPKRRCARAMDPSSSSMGAFAQQAQSPFWMTDGDFILRVEGVLFKVHHRSLSKSEIFGDMMAMPQPCDAECIDGCPLVELADSAQDWLVALRWMSDEETFVRQPITFDTLSGALRIATKYEIPALREWSVNELRSRWPIVLVDMVPAKTLPHAAEAIALSRECDVPEILPAAFYALSIQKWRDFADGGRSHLVLHPSDLRRLIAGRERLQDILIQYISNPLQVEQSDFEVCNACRPLIENYWRGKLYPNKSAPYGVWLLKELCEMVKAEYPGWCPDCAFQHHCIAWERMRTLRENIPRIFLLA